MSASVRPFPHHLALIADGNRRWARSQGLPAAEGHARAFRTVAPALLEAAWRQGIHTVTFWVFSTENWRRGEAELAHLMAVYADLVAALVALSDRHGARLCHLGRLDRVPASLRAAIEAAVQATAGREGRLVNLALDYGGGDELLRAFQRMMAAGLSPAALEAGGEALLGDFLDTAGQPHPCPDLIVRTSGEVRTSGFLPWQARYSELCFLEKGFPDLAWPDLAAAIARYQETERRWGQ